MEAPPPPAPPPSTVTHHPDSVDSSPRSRNIDSLDDSLTHTSLPGPTPTTGLTKLRLMCSYGGHIVPRPHDKSLCYVGGDTRIVVVDRQSSLSELTTRLSKTLHNGRSNNTLSSPPPPFTLKYQLPNEDLDSLISVTTDEDLENMIDEYDRLHSTVPVSGPTKSSRLRLFLFPTKPETAPSIGSLLDNSSKSEDWFLNALNGTTRGFSDSSSVNCLLGLDDDVLEVPGKVRKDVKGKGSGQDVHSVPDSPMLETTSSFGSASSSPSQANLPPIKVHVVGDEKSGGIDEQFAQMSIQLKHDESGGGGGGGGGGFTAMNLPSAALTGVPVNSAVAEYPNRDRVISDDEKSDQGIQMGYRKPLQQVLPQQQQQQMPLMQPLLLQKQGAGFDLASPDSVSSDGSLTNPLSQQRPPVIYQDQIVRTAISPSPIDQNNPDTNPRIQLQQQQIQDNQHTQLHQPPPQFIHTGSQYIYHQHPSGAVPMQSYYQMYPSQQQQQQQQQIPHPSAHHPMLDQQNIVYYIPARAPQGYNISMQQPSYNEASATARTQNVAYNSARNMAAAAQAEVPSGVYRTAASGNPQLVQMPSNQHQQAQYIGYSPVHHPSQSVAPAQAGGGGNYGYEFADPSQGHVYYAQQMAPPQSAAQYKTLTSILPEAGTLLQATGKTPQPQ